ncbi:MAG: hypothetical protein ACLU0O_07395 [Collinsella sp.]
MISGDKAFALLAKHADAQKLRAAIRNVLKNPGLRLGGRQAEHGRVAVEHGHKCATR